VVAAKLPGPAWWRISDGDTTIYVLGVLQALPRGAGLGHRLCWTTGWTGRSR
jgi:hypothetical protein